MSDTTDIPTILSHCIREILNCDEQADAEGLCSCQRYIKSWLLIFKRNELAAFDTVGSLEAELVQLQRERDAREQDILDIAHAWEGGFTKRALLLLDDAAEGVVQTRLERASS